MRKRLWDLAKSRIEIGTILPGHRHKVRLALPTRALLHVFVPCTKVNDTKRLMTEHSC